MDLSRFLFLYVGLRHAGGHVFPASHGALWGDGWRKARHNAGLRLRSLERRAQARCTPLRMQ